MKKKISNTQIILIGQNTIIGMLRVINSKKWFPSKAAEWMYNEWEKNLERYCKQK